MSLVFGFPNPKGITVSEYLHSQGINLLRCALSDFSALVTVSSNQPAYRNYTNYLPAYMAATISQQKTSILSPYHPLRYSATDPYVLSGNPDTVVSFNGVPVTETLEAIRGAGGREQKSKGTTVYLIPSPDVGLLRLLKNGGAISTAPAFLNSINLSSYATLSLVRRIATNFLITHHYPAFIDSDHLRYNKEHWVSVEESSTKRKRTEADTGRVAKKGPAVISGLEAGSSMEVEMEVESSVDTAADNIIYASPPTLTKRGHWGDAEDLPDGDGLFIRYISDTQNNKGERIVHQVIAKYFLGCLGTNGEEVKDVMTRIKADMGIISGTDQGKELAHLYKCIDIGLQAQARIFPIISERQYLGCCLMGAGFRIHAYDSVYAPTTNDILRERIGFASSHLASIESIANTIDPEDEQLVKALKNTSSMMELRGLLQDYNMSSADRERVVVFAKGLRYRVRKLPLTPDNLVTVLTLIANPDSDIPTSFPIHPTMIFDGNRSHVLWSAFGDLAPTFEFTGGARVDLQKPSNYPKHIGIRTIPLTESLIDLDLLLRNKYFSGTSPNRRSAVFKDRIYVKLDATNILTSLAKAAGATSTKESKGKEKAVAVVSDVFDDGF